MHIRSIRTLLFALIVLCMSAEAFAQIGVSITIGPPALPVFEQPLCPGEGYIWTPGYWAYDYDIGDYYWVPGTWVLAPEIGFLWTPGWWGWGDGVFLFHEGYWGPHVGFYGGVYYGFGYFGVGFEGGRWDGGRFFYNREVTNVNVTVIHNVYSKTVINNVTVNRVSYNGGNGGITARPTPEEQAAEHDKHIAPVAAQTHNMQEARKNPQQRASVNMGKPAVAATAKPGEFKGRDVVAAKESGAPYTPASRAGNASRPPTHPHDLPPVPRPSAPNTGNQKLDQKYQQQQEKQVAKQQQERDQLQQKQEQEHQRLTQQNASEQRKQQVEQQHQQQTQQLQQKHEQQQQQLQQKQQRANRPTK